MLIFAEKPSQGRAYANAFTIKQSFRTHIELEACSTFPNGAVITWGIGHLLELFLPQEYDEKYAKWKIDNLPIVPEKFRYKVSEQTKSQYNVVKRLMEQANEIIIATDKGREGELIARLVVQSVGVEHKLTKRLWLNSEEESEIRRAFNNLLPISQTESYFHEAQARQWADWLVGMNLSPLYSLLLQQKGYRGSLSIGRVQTPTVKIIYDRQQEIENFVSKPFYQLKAFLYTSSGESYEGNSNIRFESKEDLNKFLAEKRLKKNNQATITSVDKKKRRNYAPRLHSISSLQSKINKLYKYSPDTVLETVQSLYEKKLVSYPRTDCEYIGEEEFAYLLNHVEDYKQLANVSFKTHFKKPRKRYVNNKKVEEHYAIIPTRKILNKNELNTLTKEERHVYEEILISVLGMFHNDYIFTETIILTDVNGVEFRTRGRIEKEKGWREISLEKSNRKDRVLPDVSKGEDVQAGLGIQKKQTSPPKRYTEGQLIDLMRTAGKFVETESDEQLEEIEGIGTGATRSNIIERIKSHGYIEIKNNLVYVTKKGEILCKAIEDSLLASPTMTAKWETYLKKIGSGAGDRNTFISSTLKFIKNQIKNVPRTFNNSQIDKIIDSEIKSNSVAKCPSCSGYIVNREKFYGCTGYVNGCKVTFPKKLASKNITKTIVKTLCEKGRTNKLNGFTNKKGNKFKTALVLDDEFNIVFDFN